MDIVRFVGAERREGASNNSNVGKAQDQIESVSVGKKGAR